MPISPLRSARSWRHMAHILALLISISACTTTNNRRADNLKADAKIGVGKTVVMLEADVELSELLAGGVEEPRVAWTKAAQNNINEAIEQELQRRTIKLVPRVDAMNAGSGENKAKLKQLELLTQTVGFSIVRYQLSPYYALPTKKNGFDWGVGPNVKLLKTAYGADYAMVTLVRDSYASSGRKALSVLGIIAGAAVGVSVGSSTGQRFGYTLLLDLNSGKIVWANFMASQTGDLRNLNDAKKVVQTLLAGMPL
jgi:hypothetical protein